jgi:tetratricopeptide (TPR) repeat protein
MDNSRPTFLAKIAKIYYAHFDDPRSALDLYDEALSYKMNDGEKAEALFDRGVVNFRLGNYTEALEDLSDAVHADPGRYAYPSLGVVARGIEAHAFGEEELSLAYGLLSEAIDRDPANKDDYYRARAAVGYSEGDRDGALKDSALGSKHDPEFHYSLEVTPLTLEHEMGKGSTKVVVH